MSAMAEGWMRAVAEVFVEVRVDSDPADGERRERHLVAVAEPPSQSPHKRSAVPGPELVIVSLIGAPTRVELRTTVEAAARVAEGLAARRGSHATRVVVLGIPTPRLTRRRSKAEIEFVESGADLELELDRSPQVLVVDASGFHEVPDCLLAGAVIVALERDDDGSEYAQLFVKDVATRLPDATVRASCIQSPAAPKPNRRLAARSLGDSLVQIVEGQS